MARREYGGTQVLKLSWRAVREGRHAEPPPEGRALRVDPAHALRRPRDALAVLGAMTFVAKRNVHHDDDDQKGEN